MIYVLHLLLAVTVILFVTASLRGATEPRIDAVFSVVVTALMVAFFALFGWKVGVVAILSAFAYTLVATFAWFLATRVLGGIGRSSVTRPKLPNRKVHPYRSRRVYGRQFPTVKAALYVVASALLVAYLADTSAVTATLASIVAIGIAGYAFGFRTSLFIYGSLATAVLCRQHPYLGAATLMMTAGATVTIQSRRYWPLESGAVLLASIVGVVISPFIMLQPSARSSLVEVGPTLWASTLALLTATVVVRTSRTRRPLSPSASAVLAIVFFFFYGGALHDRILPDSSIALVGFVATVVVVTHEVALLGKLAYSLLFAGALAVVFHALVPFWVPATMAALLAAAIPRGLVRQPWRLWHQSVSSHAALPSLVGADPQDTVRTLVDVQILGGFGSQFVALCVCRQRLVLAWLGLVVRAGNDDLRAMSARELFANAQHLIGRSVADVLQADPRNSSVEFHEIRDIKITEDRWENAYAIRFKTDELDYELYLHRDDLEAARASLSEALGRDVPVF